MPKSNDSHYGIGINDADYPVWPASTADQGVRYKLKNRCPYYTKWRAMLVACYAPHNLKRGRTICDQWRSFMSFRAWMMKQNWADGFLTLKKGCKVYNAKNGYFKRNQLTKHKEKTMSNALEFEVNGLIKDVIASHEAYVLNPATRDPIAQALRKRYNDIDFRDPAFVGTRDASELAQLFNMPTIFAYRVAILSHEAFYAARKVGYGSGYICESVAYMAALRMIECLQPLISEVDDDHT